ncbi:MAG TPA: amino acid ABC transporter permease [Candidatus Limnocylindrales bacterium]|nr:amino acid ABC transporter permease [Candidatus Limnocylindrales bacterium]
MVDENAALFLLGYRNTILLFATAMAASLVLGTVAASMRVWGTAVVQALAAGYVEFFRNTPLLVQLFFYAVVLAPANLGVTGEPLLAAAIGLSVYTGAYVTEVVRSGILSVDPRQLETARSLGMGQLQALRHVVLPQAVRTVIPPLGNLSIALVKNTAIASAIAATELLKAASVIESRTATFTPFLAAFVAYWTLTIPLAALVGRLERRLRFAR